ncbi:putative UROD MetE-like protein [Lyophyllum shimeji]|uniref:UROD MetE-like protein n=1 Tax=Lyophyllum shimeji TaxID=47721 RepID=A0A9P3ULW9_LYOSH|nr:putative UROD MetE-like protein [Lyophyllum shimeji]
MGSYTTITLRPPFRAEHVGSLLRPAVLIKKREEFEQKRCSAEELRAVEDEAIRHVVRLQQSVGMKTITDGELRRSVFFEGIFDTLEGMTVMPNRPITAFKSYVPHICLMYKAGVKEAETIFCSGKIRRTKPFYVDDFKYLKTLVSEKDVKYIKITMCSPVWYHQRHGSDLTYDRSVYKTDDEYFDDLGIVYRAEIKELYNLGCRHIQIDDPTFCYFCSEDMLSGMEKAGVDHQALLDTYIRAINVCIQDRPNDLRISIHMCRGNYKGVHFSEGGYSPIAAKVFNKLDVDTFYLEYDTERAGDFAPLGYLPLDKTVVLGLVTTKNARLETVEELKARVNQAVEALMNGSPRRSRQTGLNQLCISPQCGFASVCEGNPVTEEDERKKLALLAETAKQIWRFDTAHACL